MDERIVEAIERLMIESVGITTVALAEATPDVELTFPQWRALVVIGSGQQGIRVGDIAGRIGSAVPTTSRLVRRLEHRGLVTSQRDERDRRATIVRLTELGERIRSSIVRRRLELVRTALSEAGSSPALDLRAGLAQIAEALQRYE